LSPVHVYHHDLLASSQRQSVSGRGCRLRDGWRVKLLDEDTRWFLSASRTKLRQDIYCNIVVMDDVMELDAVEFVLKLADF
jgi:hypothetical protein